MHIKTCILTLWIFALSQTAFSQTAKELSSARSFFDLSAEDIRGEKVFFSNFRGKVVLVVNTASECGFTPQLKDLEELFKKYKDQGFIVLGFPSNDFKQEKGNNQEVQTFATKEYGISFPLFAKNKVRGADKQPVYQFLTEQKPGLLFKEVQWNFEKFLINRKGQVVERWNSMTSPQQKSVVQKIEAELKAAM